MWVQRYKLRSPFHLGQFDDLRRDERDSVHLTTTVWILVYLFYYLRLFCFLFFCFPVVFFLFFTFLYSLPALPLFSPSVWTRLPSLRQSGVWDRILCDCNRINDHSDGDKPGIGLPLQLPMHCRCLVCQTSRTPDWAPLASHNNPPRSPSEYYHQDMVYLFYWNRIRYSYHYHAFTYGMSTRITYGKSTRNQSLITTSFTYKNPRGPRLDFL